MHFWSASSDKAFALFNSLCVGTEWTHAVSDRLTVYNNVVVACSYVLTRFVTFFSVWSFFQSHHCLWTNVFLSSSFYYFPSSFYQLKKSSVSAISRTSWIRRFPRLFRTFIHCIIVVVLPHTLTTFVCLPPSTLCCILNRIHLTVSQITSILSNCSYWKFYRLQKHHVFLHWVSWFCNGREEISSIVLRRINRKIIGFGLATRRLEKSIAETRKTRQFVHEHVRMLGL